MYFDITDVGNEDFKADFDYALAMVREGWWNWPFTEAWLEWKGALESLSGFARDASDELLSQLGVTREQLRKDCFQGVLLDARMNFTRTQEEHYSSEELATSGQRRLFAFQDLERSILLAREYGQFSYDMLQPGFTEEAFDELRRSVHLATASVWERELQHRVTQGYFTVTDGTDPSSTTEQLQHRIALLKLRARFALRRAYDATGNYLEEREATLWRLLIQLKELGATLEDLEPGLTVENLQTLFVLPPGHAPQPSAA